MANITVRNIPDEIFEKIKKLSALERRSLNSELLVILEKGTQAEIDEINRSPKSISRSLQVQLWRSLSSVWEDERPTEKIISDIYESRTIGRDITL